MTSPSVWLSSECPVAAHIQYITIWTNDAIRQFGNLGGTFHRQHVTSFHGMKWLMQKSHSTGMDCAVVIVSHPFSTYICTYGNVSEWHLIIVFIRDFHLLQRHNVDQRKLILPAWADKSSPSFGSMTIATSPRGLR